MMQEDMMNVMQARAKLQTIASTRKSRHVHGNTIHEQKMEGKHDYRVQPNSGPNVKSKFNDTVYLNLSKRSSPC